MASWTESLLAAREQLEDIVEASAGQISIESAKLSKAGGSAEITISLPTGHLARAPGGLPVRQREQFVIMVPADFPRTIPDIWAPHSRFAGFPHVQWARKLCLYQAPQQEYAPGDGMFGFIDRLNLWLKAAALNELDPEGAPLHAPAVYANADERFVIRANAPDFDPDAWHWTGAARLNKVRENRLDIIEWSPLSAGAIINEPESDFAAVVILCRPLPFEYPTAAKALFAEFEAQGYPRDLLAELMSLFALDALLHGIQGLHRSA